MIQYEKISRTQGRLDPCLQKAFQLRFVRLYPCLEGAFPEILDSPGIHQGRRGGLEIVFNQQLTRLGITSLAASLPQAQR
ncbi:hypothetical protein FRX31_013804 [Thalictrum thalictroides]|uniref:Uncharacterized protein n=1 Tax=Thalictrum thalictroides TaxID=46969 RepID=A0A7J6WJ04_THATH|nr:hypothetical protein FRX31_013804 [Thalictrum thalictroides]